MTKEEANQKIAELVQKRENLKSFEVKKYTEEATKQGFILPLFKALGWDTEETTNEVVPEEKASNGRVDYAFKLKGVSQFYVEAKPLNSDLTKQDYIKQAITYAYNNGVRWAILTDFDEIHLFNAQGNNAYITLSYKNYIAKFDKLWLLSRESLETGTLKEEATEAGAMPLLVPVEERLFRKLRDWRGQLYNELSAYNKGLKPSQINEVIQRLFNRLIFIRTCEDRGIENNLLLAAANQWITDKYKKDELLNSLKQIFQHYDDTYDSELFEKHLVDDVTILEATVESIITGLYVIPGIIAEYNFRDMKPDVLGTVYEQYLGYLASKIKGKSQSQLALDLPGGALIEFTEKKQHRKEQGIYYTPTFITDYIVRETVGCFIEEHDYNEIRTVKILDPACGSGSFLIRAYEQLLNYHAKQHHVTLNELEQKDRLPVLLNNIFGIDLDIQAVEIARLNLLLRTVTSKGKLPFVGNNIRQGNSIISGTPDELKGYFGDGYEKKLPLNWEEEFPEIMKNGGFDVVIGNPPYGADFDENDRKYISDNYPYSKDNKNSAMVFIERALNLTKEGGYFSFIIPKSLAYSQKWASGRKLILDQLGYSYDTSKAFKEVLLEQMVIVVSQKFKHQPYYEAAFLDEDGTKETVKITKELSKATDSVLLGITDAELQIFNKMTKSKLFMKDISKTARGLPFQKYLAQKTTGVPIYRGDHVARYVLHQTKETVPESVLSEADKKVSYLKQTKILSQQIIAHVQNPTDHIILMSTLDKAGIITLDTVQNTILMDKTFSYEFITGLLNSKLWSWYAYRFIYSKAIRTMHFDDYYMSKFPLPVINHNDNDQKEKIKKIESSVKKILKINVKKESISDDHKLGNIERDDLIKQASKLDKQIDNIVYDLYGLTDEERKIVEEEIK